MVWGAYSRQPLGDVPSTPRYQPTPLRGAGAGRLKAVAGVRSALGRQGSSSQLPPQVFKRQADEPLKNTCGRISSGTLIQFQSNPTKV